MSFGSSKSSGDNRFSRTGTASTETFRDLLPEHIDLFRQALGSVAPTASSSQADSRLQSELSQTNSNSPYQDELTSFIQSVLPGSGFAGQASLSSQANVNPYGSGYAENTFGRYATDAGEVMSQARSGPMMNRGGTAANGYMQARALNDLSLNREQVLQSNRIADSNISQGAAQAHSQVGMQRTGLGLQGVGIGQGDYQQNRQLGLGAVDRVNQRNSLFGELVPSYATMNSPVKGLESNNLSGQGSQSSTAMGVSGGCCWIFLESYYGQMPSSVRLFRDIWAPEESTMRKGYRRMASYLVPLMRTSKVVRRLVWYGMVSPMTKYGERYFKLENKGIMNTLVTKGWFKIWNILGRKK